MLFRTSLKILLSAIKSQKSKPNLYKVVDCKNFRRGNKIKSLKLQDVSGITTATILRGIATSPPLLFEANKMNMTDAVTYLECPDKSENDKKIYKILTLSNGLHAVLVSDPSPVPHDGLTSSSSNSNSTASEGEDANSEPLSADNTSSEEEETDSDDDSQEGDEKLAACGLLVDVGSFSEPPGYQGLAHFLEHMIFMGSEKYPVENAFDQHVKKCGGFDNANTESEETLFYFEVSEQHLGSSMDYFTALLKAPLMKKEAMTRERDAVESEFQQTLHDDEARRDQLLASLATSNYPHNAFTWGNLKSLKEGKNDDDLHKVLHEFRKHHYSAHRMYVCVQARLPIDELEHLVVKHFSDIPRSVLPAKDMSEYNYQNAFREEFYKQVFFVKAVENIIKLEISWVLPPMTKLYKCKPDQFFSYLIGYEGKGSLCAYLRQKLWGLELFAGIDDTGFDSNSFYSLFNICILLTDNGLEHLDDVLAATFAYIKLFSQESASLKDLYTELQSIEATSFRFESQKPAYDNVQDLVTHAKYYPPKDLLTGPHLYFEYNEKEIMNVLNHLNDFKFNLMLTSHQKYEGVNYDKKEKWFNTDYASIPMPQKWADLWQNSKSMPELHLPKPNQFISTDFRLFWVDDGKPEIPMSPKKILQTDTCELWFRQDDKFELPDAYMHFYLISPLLRMNPKNDVMCVLFSHLVKFRLVERLYPATVAGLDYALYSAEKGIVLKVNGYNEKLHLLVDIIVDTIINMRNIEEDQLNVFKIHQKKAFFNALIKPKTLNKDIRLSIVENIRWPMIVKYKALDEITLADMQKFCDTFTSQLYLQTLMQGNLTEEMAHNVMNSVMTKLNCQRIIDTKYIENRTVQLPQGAHYIRCHALNIKDANSVVCNFYQIGPCSVRIESILDLLMMFVEEPLFDHLRTKEQLGYFVSSSIRVNYGIAGYSITVNSQENRHPAQHVEERIEVFRSKMLQILDEMSAKEFDHVKESLIKIKQVVDMSLVEEVSRNWGEITCQEYIFDRRRKEVDVLRTLQKQEIIDFCLNNERTNLRKLSVQVVGNVKPSDGKKLENAADGTDESEPTDEDDTTDDSTDATDEINADDECDEELFNALADKMQLVFIPKDGDATHITDINDFKENLHVYPITKTKLENSQNADDRQARINSNAEIIKDLNN